MATDDQRTKAGQSGAKNASRPRRIRWLLQIGGLAICCAGAYVHFYLYLPMGSGPAGPAIDAAPFDESWTERKVLLVGLGDSVTAGFGASKGKSYFDRLFENPPDEWPDMQGRCLSRVFPNLSRLNVAVSGSNSQQHLNQIQQRLPTQEQDVFGLVVMSTGGNDLIHWYGQTPPREGAMYGATFSQAEPWIAHYEQRLEAIILAIEERFPGGCLIFVADIYDPTDGLGNPQSVWLLPPWPDCIKILAAYNAALRQVAARHANIRVVSVHDTFLGHGINCRKFWTPNYDRRDPHYWYFENVEDPNDRGYDALRRIFLHEIVELRLRISR